MPPSTTPAEEPAPEGQGPTDARLESLRHWLASLASAHGLRLDTLRPASNDASFRRYFRLDAGGADGHATFVAMDAPPPQEDVRPFVHAAGVLRKAGLRVPAIVAADAGRGFLLLDDLGEVTLLDRLAASPGDAEVDALYRAAGLELVKLQAASRPGVFPDYDRALLGRELMLFPQWYLERHLGRQLSASDRDSLSGAFDTLLANNLGQARVFVHRDYHSRNLMVTAPGDTEDRTIGVLDFQDAVCGPVTYDLVSLLRDAYASWPEERQIDWAIRWWEAARARQLPVPQDFGELWRDLEWMGLQRHLKVLGIFARLWHRDGKDRYLADIPRVLGDARKVASRYAPFARLARLLEADAAGAPGERADPIPPA